MGWKKRGGTKRREKKEEGKKYEYNTIGPRMTKKKKKQERVRL